MAAIQAVRSLRIVCSAFGISACVIMAFANQSSGADPAPVNESQRKALESLKRQGGAIVSCEINGTHFQYAPGVDETPPGEEIKSGLDISPAEMFATLRSVESLESADGLTNSLQRLFVAKKAVVDTKSGNRFYFAMQGEKTRWDYFDGTRLANRVVYNGSAWVLDSDVYNNQTTIRSQGGFASSTLGTYRFVPIGLADVADELRSLANPSLPLSLLYPSKNTEYGISNDFLTEYAIVRNDAKSARMQIFQYYFQPQWRKLAMPTHRVDCGFGGDGRLATVNMYKIDNATFNQIVEPSMFRVPLKADRLLVDERRSPVIPTPVKKSHPDALEYSALPEADSLRSKIADLPSIEKMQSDRDAAKGNKPWPLYRILLVTTGVLLVCIWIMFAIYRRRSQ